MHFHVVSAALSERLKEFRDEAGSHEVLVVDPRVVREPAVERLVQALVALDGIEEDLVALHVEALCLAILTRLLSMRCHRDLPADRSPHGAPSEVAPEAGRRLRRCASCVAHHACRPGRCCRPDQDALRRAVQGGDGQHARMTSSCTGESSARRKCCATAALRLSTSPSVLASRPRPTSRRSSSVSPGSHRTAGVVQSWFRVSEMPRRPQPRHRQSVSDVQAVVRRPIASIPIRSRAFRIRKPSAVHRHADGVAPNLKASAA